MLAEIYRLQLNQDVNCRLQGKALIQLFKLICVLGPSGRLTGYPETSTSIDTFRPMRSLSCRRSGHSVLKATIGSTRALRQAGTKAVSVVVIPRMTMASPIAAASNGRTPKSRLESRRPIGVRMATPAHAPCTSDELHQRQSICRCFPLGSERDADAYFACSARGNERNQSIKCRAWKAPAPCLRKKQTQQIRIAA